MPVSTSRTYTPPTPWPMPTKSTPLPPSIQRSSQSARYTRYTPSSTPSVSTSPSVSPGDSPPSSPTTGGATYSVPSSSARSNASSRGYSRGNSRASSGADDGVLDYMNERLASANAEGARSVSMAETSTSLTAKSLELLALQQMAQRRLAASKANFADGVVAARELRDELQELGGRVARVNERVSNSRDARVRDAYWGVERRVGRVVDEE